MSRTYALVTTVHIPSGRAEVTHQEITGGTDQWSRIVDDAVERVTRRYSYQDQEWNVTIQVQTIGEDGSIKSRNLSKCPQCDVHKIPGTRHKCDIRRAPKAGTVLTSDRTLYRWTGEPGEWSGVSWNDPRYLAIPRGVQVTVIEVVDHEAQPEWEFDGMKFAAQPAHTDVRFFVTLTGEWEDESEAEWCPGEQSERLEDFRKYVKGMDVANG